MNPSPVRVWRANTNGVTLLVLLMLLAACGGTPPDTTPAATLTLVPSTTPQGIVTNPYAGIAVGTSPEGYPTIGSENAPIDVTEFGSYDSPASRTSHDEIFSQLLPRIQTGEIIYTYVPLSGTGSIPNGGAAARAALCAGEQGAFWQYHDRLFALQEQDGDVFSGASLLNLVDELGLNRDQWNNCALGDGVNDVLRNAQEAAIELETYAGTPTILVNGSYVLNELFSINQIIDQILAQVDESGAIAALPTPDIPPTPEQSPTPEVELGATTNQVVEPPLTIDLPEGWEVALTDTLLLRDVDAIRTIPFTLYKGPVDGGTGSIVLLWGFPNVTTGNPFEVEMGLATPTPNLRIDGSRLLRLAVVEQGCNVGTDLEREYTVGGITGVGTAWSAVDCPELLDTRGWFVGVRQFDLNFMFYAFVEPIEPSGMTEAERNARARLQAILDTVTFREIDETAAINQQNAAATATNP